MKTPFLFRREVGFFVFSLKIRSYLQFAKREDTLK